MDLVQKIEELCITKNITFHNLEQALGFGNGTIRRWNDNIPKTDRLLKIADHFHVSTDYLLGREPEHNFYDFQFSISKSVYLTEEDKEKLIKTFKDITSLYLDAKGK